VGIRYYFTRATGAKGLVWGYWIPCLARRSKKSGKIEPTMMAQLGFKIVDCGQDGPRAWAIAESWNAKWDEAFARHRSGEAPNKLGKIEKVFPPGSLGDGFSRFRATTSWKKKPAGTRADWMRGWTYIEPIFGDVAPSTVSFEDVDDWYWAQHAAIGVRESHRGLKIWRALWRIVGRLRTAGGDRYCNPKDDPSLAIRRETPAPRNAIWMEGEAVRLVKRAWRLGYRGLAAGLAVAWDTSLSPVDVRTLTKAQLTGDAEGPFFSRDRTKTGESAIGTLGKRTQRLLAAYMATLPPNLLPSAPIFYTRGGQPGPKGGRPRWETISGSCARLSSVPRSGARSWTSAAVAPSRRWRARSRRKCWRPRWRTPSTRTANCSGLTCRIPHRWCDWRILRERKDGDACGGRRNDQRTTTPHPTTQHATLSHVTAYHDTP
jgi:hypothetical protein